MGSQRAQVGGDWRGGQPESSYIDRAQEPTGYLFPSPYPFLISSKKVPLLLCACLPVTGVLVSNDSPLFFWCRKGKKMFF